jgi:YtkA-like protein
MAPEALAGRLIVWVLASCCILAGCSRRGTDVTVTWTIDPPRPAAGVEIAVRLGVRNSDGTPATGLHMQCAAQMSHAGMAPIISPVVERGSGVYETRLQLSMPGDWVLVASGELPGGRSMTSSFRIPGVAPAKTPASLP